MKRVGVVGIIIKKDNKGAAEVQKILSEHADIITGRMGVPDRINGIYAISVIVMGENEEI